MEVVCPRCASTHRTEPPDHLRGRGGMRFRCTKCGHVFRVEFGPVEPAPVAAPVAAPVVAPAPVSAAAPAPVAPAPVSAPEAADADASRGPVYTVRAEGEIYPPTDLASVQRWILEHRVKADDAISVDGDRWRRAGDLPELSLFFVAASALHTTYAPPEPAALVAPAPVAPVMPAPSVAPAAMVDLNKPPLSPAAPDPAAVDAVAKPAPAASPSAVDVFGKPVLAPAASPSAVDVFGKPVSAPASPSAVDVFGKPVSAPAASPSAVDVFGKPVSAPAASPSAVDVFGNPVSAPAASPSAVDVFGKPVSAPAASPSAVDVFGNPVAAAPLPRGAAPEPDEVTRVEDPPFVPAEAAPTPSMLSVLQERTEELRKGPVPVRRDQGGRGRPVRIQPEEPAEAPALNAQSVEDLNAEFAAPYERGDDPPSDPFADDPALQPAGNRTMGVLAVVLGAVVIGMIAFIGWRLTHADPASPVGELTHAAEAPGEAGEPAKPADPAGAEPMPADPAAAEPEPAPAEPSPAAVPMPAAPTPAEPPPAAVPKLAEPKLAEPKPAEPKPAPTSRARAAEPAPSSMSASDAAKKGWALAGKGEFEQAFDAFSKGLQKSPGNANLLYGRGYANEKLGDSGSAVADYCDALARPSISEDIRRELQSGVNRLHGSCP